MQKKILRFPPKTKNTVAISSSNTSHRHMSRENYHWKDTCTLMFIAALFIIAKIWMQPKCPSTDEWIKKMWYGEYLVSSVQLLTHVRFFATPWTEAYQDSLSNTNSQNLLKLMSIELVMPSNHLILCHSLLLLPSIFPSIKVLSNESVLPIRWPKYWRFSFSVSPSNEYSGLLSFRMDWLNLIAVQGRWILITNCYSPIKEWNNAICSYKDGPSDYHTKRSKSERERQIPYDIT